MIKVTILLRRKQSLSLAQFIDYHRTHHAPLFMSLPIVQQTVRRYEQQHSLGIELPGLPMGRHDGITNMWFDNMEAFGRLFNDPEYMRVVRPDEIKFLELQDCEILLTQENVVL